MCGFIGGTDPDWNYQAALDCLAHRGPDASGLSLDGPVRIGFRRLSIIDLADEANQPMFSADRSHWIAFNGEIYGFQRLRRELETRGHRFRTQSDTEVVLNAYCEWGDEFVERIDGMFAIALWDGPRRRLKLFRDRPGIKPLYYYYDGRRLAFASELKAIETALGRDRLEIDASAMYDFLGYRYVPEPKTMYRNCFKLEPGHRLSYDPETGALEGPTAFWELPAGQAPLPLTADEAAEELRRLIDESVRDQMVADVPLGFFLSGGVDSSAVVASAASTGRKVSTFSIGFDSDRVSETPYAREVAELFGTDHHERILSADAAQDLLPRLKTWFDEPFGDESAMPTYLVSKTAREHVTVVLTGDGGDEVFGGYRTYPRYARYASWPSWPRSIDRWSSSLRARLHRRSTLSRVLGVLEMGMSDGPELWARIMGGMPEGAKTRYRERFGLPRDYDDWWHYRAHWRDDLPLRTRLQYLDFHTFMPGLVLTKVDRTSMAVSLEARVPLLARSIIEFSFALREDVRYFGGEPKGLLRHTFRGVLPDGILDRRKKGFGIPRYYLGDLGDGIPVQEFILKNLYLDRPPITA
jgi:asparagine synthase (glutamine-hydrolysing)